MSDDNERLIQELKAKLAALEAQQTNQQTNQPTNQQTSQPTQSTRDNDGLALNNSGDLTTGDLTNVGERAATVGRDVSGFVITGDNNHVAQIIQQMGAMPLTPEEMRREIGRYLSWVSDRTGTIELRGIKREGQQVVQLDLETVYVPLSANRGWG
ncbi:MAG: hypothetical protein KDD89_17235, partial [Anaerolineales bacterium]|nr:hypothetical protein [Anaerolineales bacterium]